MRPATSPWWHLSPGLWTTEIATPGHLGGHYPQGHDGYPPGVADARRSSGRAADRWIEGACVPRRHWVRDDVHDTAAPWLLIQDQDGMPSLYADIPPVNLRSGQDLEEWDERDELWWE